MSDIVITAHAAAQAEKRLGLSRAELGERVRRAKHTGAARDGLECWRSGEAYLMIYPIGMCDRPPIRLEVVSVLAGPRVASAVDKAAIGRGSHRWRQAKRLGDLFERRGKEQ